MSNEGKFKGEFRFSSNCKYANKTNVSEDRYVTIQYVEDFASCIIEASNWGQNGIFTNNLYKNVMTINRLESNHKLRNKGIATELLTRLCNYADSNRLTLELGVSPDIGGGLDYNELVSFYKKFGFRPVNGMPSIMVRVPSNN